MVAIFVVRVTEVGCVLMYRPIGTPATPSGLCFCCVFASCLHLRGLAVVRCTALQLALRQSCQSIGPFMSCLIHFGRVMLRGPNNARLPVNSSHGHVVTRSTRHKHVSSHSQLVTSEHIPKALASPAFTIPSVS